MIRPDSIAVYGLTGGIGSGKSEVGRVLALAGIPVIDADRVAYEQARRGGDAFKALVEEFGPGILGPTGEIDRNAVADVVFNDPEKLELLNGITHGLVMEEVGHRLGVLASMGHPAAVVEAALLVETRASDDLDGLLVVTASEENRVRRVVDRDGHPEEHVRKRMAAQLPDDQKAARADWVIVNDDGIEELRRAASDVAVAIARRRSR